MANNTFFSASKTQFARQTIMPMAGKFFFECMVWTPLYSYINKTICPTPWRADSLINVWRMTFGGQIVLLMYGLAGRLYVITNTWIAPKHIHSTIFIRTSLVDRDFSILQFSSIFSTLANLDKNQTLRLLQVASKNWEQKTFFFLVVTKTDTKKTLEPPS